HPPGHPSRFRRADGIAGPDRVPAVKGVFVGAARCGRPLLSSPTVNDLFLRTCRGEATERRPVWLVRQAGRYLPEYRAVRQKVDFLPLCKPPELAAEVTIQPVDILGVDAAILFADILLPLEAMGAELQFVKGDGPSFPHPVRTRGDIDRLRDPEV